MVEEVEGVINTANYTTTISKAFDATAIINMALIIATAEFFFFWQQMMQHILTQLPAQLHLKEEVEQTKLEATHPI